MSTAPRRMPAARRLGLGIAAALIGAGALSGCVSTEVAAPYTPGIGINAEQQGVNLRAVTVVAKDGKGVLAGSLDSASGDTLTAIKGSATGSNFEDLGALQTGSTTIQLPAGTFVNLTEKKIALSSDDLVPGLYARLTFTFEKAGELTVLVPVVDADQPDYASAQPQG
ncbi:hypothetical protein ACSDQ9_06835 [Aestuariimicrobium soli]|uniref:hypothetical protein n=1 Tax=Aestuariimicrobium soli TaxID=2035834 RepID=UPI003EB93777